MRTLLLLLAALLLVPLLRAGDSLRLHGRGTAGNGGFTPLIWASPTPRPGESAFSLLVERGMGKAPLFTLLAAGPGNLNLGGLRLNLDPTSLLVLPPVLLAGKGPGAGRATLPLPIPNLSVLLGLPLHAQAFVGDGAGPMGFAASRGLEITPARYGLLVVPTSVGGSGDPQVAVDLKSGKTLDIRGGVDNGQTAAFTAGSDYLMITGTLSRNLAIYDARAWPPTHLKSYRVSGANGKPWSVTANPDGKRAYVVMEGPRGTNCTIDVIWAVPVPGLLGTPYPGGNISLGNVGDALNLVFDAAGDKGYLAVLGLISGGGRVELFDTRPGSATYHRQLKTFPFPGKYVWGVDVSPDGSRVYAIVAGLGTQSTIAVIDTNTDKLIDFDPKVPGVQNIGGQMGVPRTAIEKQVTFIKAGPRGRYLYLSNFHSVSRLNVDPTDPNHLQILTNKSPQLQRKFTYGIAVTDAGDRIYVTQHSGTKVVEFDTATMAIKRSFTVGGNAVFPALR